MGQHAERAPATGDDIALRGKRDIGAGAADAAFAADADVSLASVLLREGEVEADVAATASDGLRKNPEGIGAHGLDITDLDNIDGAADAAVAGRSADCQVEAHVVLVLPGVSSRQIEIAVTAAAADRLGQDAVAAFQLGEDIAEVIDRSIAAIARFTAGSADGEIRGEAGLGLVRTSQADAGDEIHARIAAAAADAGSFDAIGALAGGGDLAGGRQDAAAVDDDIAGMTTPAAGTADADVDRRAFLREHTGDIHAAGAAAAADRLGDDPAGVVTGGVHDAVMGDQDIAGIGAGAGVASDAGDDGQVGLAAGVIGIGEVDLAAHVHAAVAAAAGDALGHDAVDPFTGGGDVTGVIDGDRAADRTGTAETAHADGDGRNVALLGESKAAADIQRAIAAAATDRLGHDAGGYLFLRISRRGEKIGRGVDDDVLGDARIAAETADADDERGIRYDAPADVERAIASSAAEALSEDGRVARAVRGNTLAGGGDIDATRIAAVTAEAAETDDESVSVALTGGVGDATGNIDATIAAAAADRLRSDTMGAAAFSELIVCRGDHAGQRVGEQGNEDPWLGGDGAGIGDADISRVAADAAEAADADGSREGLSGAA